jgi:hypothetical protein
LQGRFTKSNSAVIVVAFDWTCASTSHPALAIHSGDVKIAAMSNSAPTTTVLHADPEHQGLRTAVVLAMVVALFLAFLLIRWLLGIFASGSDLLDYAFIISCTGAVPAALAATWLVENRLKQTWHSGLRLLLQEPALRVEYNGRARAESESTTSPVIDWTQRVTALRWTFRLQGYPRSGREQRLPDTWHCLACELQQEDVRVSVYGYLPADAAADWSQRRLSVPFRRLNMVELSVAVGRKNWKKGIRPEMPSEILAGPDGRYWLAERRRWLGGLELAADDFATFMAYVEARLVEAPASSSAQPLGGAGQMDGPHYLVRRDPLPPPNLK